MLLALITINHDQHEMIFYASRSHTKIAQRFDLIPFPQGNRQLRNPNHIQKMRMILIGRELEWERLTPCSRFKFKLYTRKISLAKIVQV